MREYIISVADPSVWDTLWDELTVDGLGDNFIPTRAVQVLNDRPFNDYQAHFNLTDAEADLIRKDPRIQTIELQADLRTNVYKKFNTIRHGIYDKSFSINNTMKNWGLIRASSEANPFGALTALETDFNTHDLEGEGVDLVVVDTGVEAGHPEFAVNADGTGGSRVIDFNWASLGVSGCPTSAQVNGYLGDADGHGSNCASIAAGNTCGWASKANIYSIRIFSGYSIRTGQYLPAINSDIAYDLVRAFHLKKIQDGITRPTVCTNSWGYYATYSGITATYWRGMLYPGGSGATYGQVNYYHPYSGIEYLNNSVDNCAAAGVILCGAAGNYRHKVDKPGGIDYNNYWVYGNNVENIYYHRGMSPTCAPSMINVGALDNASIDQKVYFSETGPRVDVYSPGVMIMGAYANKSYQTVAVQDPRASGYYLNKISGTSQATPQVAGVVCCLMSVRPNATTDQVKAWLYDQSTKNALVEGNDTSYSSSNCLQGAENRLLRKPFNKSSLRGWMSST